MENRVANRSLFKNKSGARDKLRSLGGIMASSQPLLDEAYKSIDAPVNQMTGMSSPTMGSPMPPMQMRPPMPMQTPPPMPQQMRPPMPMQTPPPMPVAPAPVAPAPVAPAPAQAQAPSLNPFAQAGGLGYAQGGVVTDSRGDAVRDSFGNPVRTARLDMDQKAGELKLSDMTSKQAASLGEDTISGKLPFTSPFTQDNVGDKAPELTAGLQEIGAMMRDPDMPSEDKARMLAAYTGGNPKAKDMNKEMKKVAKQTFGKELNSNQKIDALNKSITGFAIASGTSPRASVNFAKGMQVGMLQMKATEEKRIAATSGAAGGEKSRQEFRYNAVFSDAFKAALGENPNDQQGALRIATELARGAAPLAPSAQGGGGSVTEGSNLNAEQQALIAQANEAIAAGKDPAAVRQSLEKMGIPSGVV